MPLETYVNSAQLIRTQKPVKVSYSLRFQFLTTVQDANTPGLAKPASLRTSDWTVPLTVKRMLPAPMEDELAP